MADTVDEYLAHFGVKGMKWGKHTKSAPSSSSSAPKKTRSELRSLNKAARAENKVAAKADRQKAKDEYDNEINTARNNLDKHAEKYNDAKKQYKADKAVMGKVAAKKILKEHEEKFINTWNTATLQTTKEAHASMIAGVGLLAVSAVIPVAAGAARASW